MSKLSVLLIEDKPSDVRLVVEAFKENNIHNDLSVIGNGADAIDFLLKKGKYKDAPVPDIILLDLKLPKKSGLEVLKVIKTTTNTSNIPVVVLSNSDADQDIEKSYEYKANCYVTKPLHMKDFIEVVKLIENFWLGYVKYPKKK